MFLSYIMILDELLTFPKKCSFPVNNKHNLTLKKEWPVVGKLSLYQPVFCVCYLPLFRSFPHLKKLFLYYVLDLLNWTFTFVFAEGDMPSTVVTPLPRLQTMSNSREEEVRTGAGRSTGESSSSSCLTVQVQVDRTTQHMAETRSWVKKGLNAIQLLQSYLSRWINLQLKW